MQNLISRFITAFIFTFFFPVMRWEFLLLSCDWSATN